MDKSFPWDIPHPFSQSSVSISSIFPFIAVLLLAVWLLGLDGGWLFGPDLGGLGLTDRDEGSNAEAAREMLETGDWISPTLNYEPRYAKPAFVYWLISGSYLMFGINEFAARFPSAVSGLCLLLLHYLFVRTWAGSKVAIWSSLMLLLNLEFLGINRMVLTDPELVVFTTMAGYCFWQGLQYETYRRWWFAMFYLAMGFGMLVKGPVGIIIPMMGVIPYLTLTRQWGTFWQKGFPLVGTVLGRRCCGTLVSHDVSHSWRRLLGSGTSQYDGPVHEPHGRSWRDTLFLSAGGVGGIFPMERMFAISSVSSFETMEGILAGAGGFFNRATPGIFSEPVGCGIVRVLYALGHAPATLHLSGLSGSSGAGLPLVEALSVGPDAGGIDDSTRILTVVGYLLGIAFMFTPVAFHLFIKQIVKEFPAAVHMELGWLPYILGIVIILGTMLMRHIMLSDSKRHLALFVGWGMMVIFTTVAAQWGLPLYQQYFIAPPQELAVIAGYNLGPDDRFIQFGRKRPSLSFYAKHKVYSLGVHDEDLPQHLAVPGRKMALIQTPLRGQLPEAMADWNVVLDHGGFSLLSNEPVL